MIYKTEHSSSIIVALIVLTSFANIYSADSSNGTTLSPIVEIDNATSAEIEVNMNATSNLPTTNNSNLNSTVNSANTPPINPNDNSTVNSTLNSSSNSTNNSTVNSTTVVPPLPTLTPSSTGNVKPFTPTLDNFYCLCDHHFNFCDMNCCCDQDCLDEEKAVFSSCSDTPISIGRQRSCFFSDYVFRNNTPFLMERKENGLFCIAYDNNKGKEELKVPQYRPGTIPSESESEYMWHPFVKEPKQDSKSGPYKYGQAVKILKQTDYGEFNGTFNLPSSFHGHECLALEPVKYMEDTSAICVHQIFNFSAECGTFFNNNANSFLRNTYVVGNPAVEFANDNSLEITYLMCDGNLKCTKIETIEDPYAGASICNNVLQRLDLIFVHNGKNGIEEVVAKIVLANYSISTKEIKQEFHSNFVWKHEFAGEDNETSIELAGSKRIIPKSGNPGYIFGKPVIMGIKVLRDQTEDNASNKSQRLEELFWGQRNNKQAGVRTPNEKEEAILLNADPNKWMTVLGPGECNIGSKNRRPVLFGRSIKTVCRLNVSDYKSCPQLQLSIGNILLGVPPSNFTKRYVSSFGNPKFNDIKDWAQVHTSESPFGSAQNSYSLVDNGCDGIVGSMHIQIAYAYVGSVQYPQAAILGVLYEFGKSHILVNKTLRGSKTHMSISTTVGFADITTSPKAKIAEWPILSIQLPPDFFYPFSWASSNAEPTCRQTGAAVFSIIVIFKSFWF